MKPVSLFHIGPPKTATTWLYRCLREHPDIRTSLLDRIHYFDMHYTRGEAWYLSQFTYGNGNVLFDPTYTYICSPRAPERIARYNPQAKIMVCLRHPIERAYSHYWHLKRQNVVTVPFQEVLVHYNHFATWMEHGFVAIGLKRYHELFPKGQLHPILFENLINNPAEEFLKVVRFAGLDEFFVPDLLDKKINVAGPKQTLLRKILYRIGRLVCGERIDQPKLSPSLIRWFSGKGEYLVGLSDALYDELLEICEPEIQQTEELLNLDLSNWRRRRGDH